jgi:hypothetical protein
VVTAAGRRAFVKAASPGLNERTVELRRRQAAVAAALPAEVPAPELRGVHDDGEWIALVFEDVGGRCPCIAVSRRGVRRGVGRVGSASCGPVPATLRKLLPDLGVMLADDLGGWRRIAHDPPGNLDAWTVRHLDQLQLYRARGPVATNPICGLDIESGDQPVPSICRDAVFDRCDFLDSVGNAMISETIPITRRLWTCRMSRPGTAPLSCSRAPARSCQITRDSSSLIARSAVAARSASASLAPA